MEDDGSSDAIQPTEVAQQTQVQVPMELTISNVYTWIISGPPMLLTWAMLKVTLVAIAISSLAVFFYGSLYYSYIPTSTIVRQLHFYKSEVTKERADGGGSIRSTTVQVLHVEVPTMNGDEALLNPGQQYNIELELDMPDSETNHDAGTFMVSSLYYDKKDKLLTSSSRLVMMRYRSWLLRIMDTIVYSPFYLLGISEQTQIRNIQLFKSYNENAYRPTALITIDIDNAVLQMYGATMVIRAQFRGLRYYMYYWPIVTAIISVSFLWVTLFFILGSSYLALSTNGVDRASGNDENAAPELTTAAQSEQSIPAEDELAPNEQDTRLGSAERAATDVDNHTEVTNLGVTPLDSSDMTKNEPLVRRRNHPAEQAST